MREGLTVVEPIPHDAAARYAFLVPPEAKGEL